MTDNPESLDLFGGSQLDLACGYVDDILRALDGNKPWDAHRSAVLLRTMLQRLRGRDDRTPPAIHAQPTVTEVAAQLRAAKVAPKRRALVMNLLIAAGAEGLTGVDVDAAIHWKDYYGIRVLHDMHYAQPDVVVRTARERDNGHIYVHKMFHAPEMGDVRPRTEETP